MQFDCNVATTIENVRDETGYGFTYYQTEAETQMKAEADLLLQFFSDTFRMCKNNELSKPCRVFLPSMKSAANRR